MTAHQQNRIANPSVHRSHKLLIQKRNHIRELEALGYKVTLQPAA
jgi:hypothetical protein